MKPHAETSKPRIPRWNARIEAISLPSMGAKIISVLVLLLALALLVWVGLGQLSTPDAAPTDAATTEFSAERAMEHLRVIAAEPRAAGSPGHIATRDYLVSELDDIGLDPQIQSATVLVEGEAGVEGFTTGTVYNVVARIPGTNSSGAIALDAHYDSGATGPGAMDAGAGVVAVLESVRAIQAGPALQNDVIIIFADGEETGMLGAAAFNDAHPWADDIALTLNYEGAGGNGAAMLYATSENNDRVVAEFLNAAPNANAYSLLPSVVHLLPDARLDCDLGEYTENGSAGLGFVSIGNTPAYHTLRDNPDLIDSGSVQQMGGYTLASLRHFGNLDLRDLSEGGDRVFFNILPGTVLSYPSTLVVPLAALITTLVLALTIFGVRNGEMSIAGLVGGALSFLLGTIGATAVAALAWAAIRMLNADYQVMMIGSYQSTLYVIALLLLTIAAVSTLYTLLGRRLRLYNLAAGALIGALIPLWISSVAVPGMSYLVSWPILFAVLPLAWYLLGGTHSGNPIARAIVLAIAIVPAMILAPGTLYAMSGLANRLEGLMALPILGVTMLFIAPLIGLLVLHLDFLRGQSDWSRWTVPIITVAIALALIGWGNLTSGFDAEQPRPDRIAYHLNADTDEAHWISRDQHLDHWTGQFFPDDAETTDYDSLLLGTTPAWVADAPRVDVPMPSVELVSDVVSGNTRTLDIHLNAPSPRVMVAEITSSTEISQLEVNGHPVDLAEFEWARDGSFPIVNSNVSEDGWDVSITTAAEGTVIVDVEVATDDLPEDAVRTFQPRPPNTMPAPDYARDPTVVRQSFHY